MYTRTEKQHKMIQLTQQGTLYTLSSSVSVYTHQTVQLPVRFTGRTHLCRQKQDFISSAHAQSNNIKESASYVYMYVLYTRLYNTKQTETNHKTSFLVIIVQESKLTVSLFLGSLYRSDIASATFNTQMHITGPHAQHSTPQMADLVIMPINIPLT